MLIYLAGSIEYSPDLGKGWRAEITPLLKSLGHDVYNPAEDEMKNLSEIEVGQFRSWKHSDLPRFQETVRKIIAEVAKRVGGKGGGRPDLAEAGGSEPGALDSALQSSVDVVRALASY